MAIHEEWRRRKDKENERTGRSDGRKGGESRGLEALPGVLNRSESSMRSSEDNSLERRRVDEGRESERGTRHEMVQRWKSTDRVEIGPL